MSRQIVVHICKGKLTSLAKLCLALCCVFFSFGASLLMDILTDPIVAVIAPHEKPQPSLHLSHVFVYYVSQNPVLAVCHFSVSTTCFLCHFLISFLSLHAFEENTCIV